VNLSLRDILAGGVGHWLSKVKDFREYVLDANCENFIDCGVFMIMPENRIARRNGKIGKVGKNGQKWERA
jgi:hypothetical protein